MSRAFKNSLVDEADDLSTGALNTTAVERLSGADLEQLRLASLNGSNPSVNSSAVKTVGTNFRFTVLGVITALPGASFITLDRVDNIVLGQVVDIIDADGVTVHGNDRSIVSINPVTKNVQYGGADVNAALAVGDFVCVTTPRPSNAALSGADLERYAGDQ